MSHSSQYLSIEREVGALLKKKEFDYVICTKELEALISRTFKSLNTATNPVVVNLPDWEEEDVKFLVKEYSGFSNESIHMFLDANIRLRWKDVKEEIDRNVGEEMGVRTQGIPHLELMRHGYRDELGVETDGVEYSLPTVGFLNKMRDIFRSPDNAFACGALLAFEATATFEFKGVEKILRRLKALQGGEIAADSLTGIYIAGHVSDEGAGTNPEDDHYDGMRKSIGKRINRDNAEAFIRGFAAVCTALNVWWEELATEVYAERLRRNVLEPQKIGPVLDQERQLVAA